MNRRSVVTQEREATLGTFAGVFTPSVLTILGIILFLRLGYVVGNAGLRRRSAHHRRSPTPSRC